MGGMDFSWKKISKELCEKLLDYRTRWYLSEYTSDNLQKTIAGMEDLPDGEGYFSVNSVIKNEIETGKCECSDFASLSALAAAAAEKVNNDNE